MSAPQAPTEPKPATSGRPGGRGSIDSGHSGRNPVDACQRLVARSVLSLLRLTDSPKAPQYEESIAGHKATQVRLFSYLLILLSTQIKSIDDTILISLLFTYLSCNVVYCMNYLSRHFSMIQMSPSSVLR